MYTPNPDFEALKDITRLSWLLNSEALATVPDAEGVLVDKAGHRRPLVPSPSSLRRARRADRPDFRLWHRRGYFESLVSFHT
jgi:hypothetical protein